LAAALRVLMNISMRRWQSDISPVGSEKGLDFAPIWTGIDHRFRSGDTIC
jgi:hypothetical protein